MANRYWVGGTGTWDPASTSWSTTSGGSSGSAAPLATDNAIFDANSGGGTITIEDGPGGSGFPPECADLICTGFTGTLEYPFGLLNVNGNVTLSSGGTYTALALYIISPTVCTLTSVGKSVYEINIESGATVTLADAANLQVDGFLTVFGTFTTNNFSVTSGSINIWDTATLNMGSSTFNVSGGQWYAESLSTINAGTSTINMSGTTGDFDGGGKTYYNLNTGMTNRLDIHGDNTFNTISNSVQPTTIFFDNGSTTTVTNFTVSGTAGNLVTLRSPTTTPQWTLSKASGTVSVDYLSIRSSNATGGAAWYAGTNSTNVTTNTGWIFTAPPASTATGNFLMFF
jgi:hypothetical protein